MGPLVRVVDAGLGADAQVRLVVSGVSAPDRLRMAWASSGAAVERRGERLHARTTVPALTRAAGRCLPRAEADALQQAVEATMAAWKGPAAAVPVTELATPKARPLVMGVVNVTPDSFSDGGLLYPDGHPDRAVTHARALAAEGADVLDIGGQSTRPGSEPVSEAEELRRVVPVLESLADVGVVRSIDTSKAAVARAAVAAGARIVNDVSGGADPALLEAVAETQSVYVLMHTRGTPVQMPRLAEYTDVVAEVYEFLAEGIGRCADAGIAPECIIVDPGLGFAKTAEHSVGLLRAIRQFRGLGRPVLIGASRKSFLSVLLGGAEPDERLEASLACAALATADGAAMLRVHDVAATVRVVTVAHAIASGMLPAQPLG